MEVDSSEPFIIKEIGTRINLLTKIETKFNFITKIEANTTKVEEAISFAILALRCDFMAHDSTPLASQQTLNDQGMTKR
jgi:hypothetical protein